jgi:adenylate cyclase class 2
VAEPREVEVKLRAVDAEGARSRLRSAGAERVHPRHLEDNRLFDDGAGRLRTSGSVLRLRVTPAGGILTFKGPREVRDGIKSRVELETGVAEPNATLAILQRLGYRPVFRYQKYRESWSLGGQRIEVDETPIGTFLEIEGDVEGIHAVARELGYSRSDYMGESYVELFFASGGQGDMVFPE